MPIGERSARCPALLREHWRANERHDQVGHPSDGTVRTVGVAALGVLATG